MTACGGIREGVLFVLLFFAAVAVGREGGVSDVPPALALPAEVLIAVGSAEDLLSDVERRQLGIRNGPDSPAVLWRTREGTFLVFSGRLQDGRQGTFRIRVDEGLRKLAGAPSPSALEVLLTAQGGTGFDRDYAGGGTVFECPGGSPTLYFYHGENHTDPTGKFHPGPERGWSGIGLAIWDGGQRRFVKIGQVLGLAVSNEWRPAPGGPVTAQTPPASGIPSAFLHSGDANVYLYYQDRTDEGAYVQGDLKCDTRACTAVARASVAELCAASTAGRSAAWKKFHRGGFESPGLHVAGDGSGSPPGTGGRFTPIVPREERTGENIPNVTFLKGRGHYVMAALRRPDGALIARYSGDGLRWSVQSVLVAPPPPGILHTYPRIHESADGTPVLTYTRRTEDRWTHAQLVRQVLRYAAR